MFNRIRGKEYVHVLHIGKTGGTAVKFALRQHRVTDQYVIELCAHSVKLRDVPANDHVVFFLRDPMARFVSGFYSRQRQGQPRYFSRWTPVEEQAFKWFESPNALALALSSPDEDKRTKAETAMRGIKHVGDSFWGWVDSEDYFRSRLAGIFFVGFQERLGDDFRLLCRKLGLPDSVQLPTDEVNAHHNPNHLDRSLDDQAVENLKCWYERDYRFIELCRETLKI